MNVAIKTSPRTKKIVINCNHCSVINTNVLTDMSDVIVDLHLPVNHIANDIIWNSLIMKMSQFISKPQHRLHIVEYIDGLVSLLLTRWKPSYFRNGNPNTGKDEFDIENEVSDRWL